MYALAMLLIPIWSLGQADSLTHWQKDSLQINSMQKLRSFYNCISIVSNPGNNTMLRDMASKRAKELFYGTDCSVDGKMVNAFVDSCYNLKKGLDWKVEEVKIKGALKEKPNVLGNDNYEGVLSFTLTSGGNTSTKSAFITLAKAKTSQTDAKSKWSVFICDIR